MYTDSLVESFLRLGNLINDTLVTFDIHVLIVFLTPLLPKNGKMGYTLYNSI